MRELLGRLEAAFQGAADPEKARPMSAYMKLWSRPEREYQYIGHNCLA